MAAPETFYDVAMRRLDAQKAQIDALDAKGAALTTTAGLLLPIFGALLASFVRHMLMWAYVVFGIAFALYLAMVVIQLVLATRVKGWSNRPDLKTLEQHASRHNELTVKRWVAAEAAASVARNNGPLMAKGVAASRAFAGFIGVVALLVVSAFIQIF